MLPTTHYRDPQCRWTALLSSMPCHTVFEQPSSASSWPFHLSPHHLGRTQGSTLVSAPTRGVSLWVRKRKRMYSSKTRKHTLLQHWVDPRAPACSVSRCKRQKDVPVSGYPNIGNSAWCMQKYLISLTSLGHIGSLLQIVSLVDKKKNLKMDAEENSRTILLY